MKKYLINLDRSADRLASFTSVNRHLTGIERFSGVDGQQLSEVDLIRQGKIEPGHYFNAGALGSALSHVLLWEKCINLDEPITIIEDDAILSYNFAHELRMLDNWRPHWDHIAWGWNFDMPLWLNLMPNVAPFKLQTSQKTLRSNILQYQKQDFEPKLMRLAHSFGIMCYSITPQGAFKMLQHCFPLKPVDIKFEFAGSTFRGHTIDVVMAGAYLSMEAYVSVPPLAVSENRHENSLIINS